MIYSKKEALFRTIHHLSLIIVVWFLAFFTCMVEDFKKEDEALALLFIRGKIRDCVTFATLGVPRSLSLKESFNGGRNSNR